MKLVKHAIRITWFELASLTLVIAIPAMAQFSPYSDFENMSPSQLASLQAKLTYGGTQEEPISTIVITSTNGSVNISQFTPFRHAGFNYGNDALPIRQISASTLQLQTMLQSAGTIPAVVAGGVGSPGYLSFALVNTVSGTTEGFEVILTPADAISLLSAISAALTAVPTGQTILADFACTTGLRAPAVPVDVTSAVKVTLSGVRLNRSTGRFVGTATLQNNGASALSLPISLVMTLPQGVTLYNANGSTCGVGPIGRPFINAPLTMPLPPGSTVQINLDFYDPKNLPITSTNVVLAGPGAR
jgi:hypothetical protein